MSAPTRDHNLHKYRVDQAFVLLNFQLDVLTTYVTANMSTCCRTSNMGCPSLVHEVPSSKETVPHACTTAPMSYGNRRQRRGVISAAPRSPKDTTGAKRCGAGALTAGSSCEVLNLENSSAKQCSLTR